MSAGITYTTTGNRARGQVAHYHGKPHPLNHNKTAHDVDIAGLKKKAQREVIFFDGCEYVSRFTIGFEIEKNSLHRSAVKEYPLFCGFERDGSCGYEAVTHILPLLPSGQWRNKVFDLFVQAEKIIDDRFSPSDKRCGGHITIAVEGLTGDQVREAIRKNCGIILALFRKRLKNSYCGYNRRLHGYNDTNFAGGWHSKYQTALVKGGCLEFRLPSRIESVKQMMRRYELFFEVVNFTFNNPRGSHEALLSKVAPIILSMYNGDSEKAAQIIDSARHFRKYIMDGTITAAIDEYV